MSAFDDAVADMDADLFSANAFGEAATYVPAATGTPLGSTVPVVLERERQPVKQPFAELEQQRDVISLRAADLTAAGGSTPARGDLVALSAGIWQLDGPDPPAGVRFDGQVYELLAREV